ncbi:MAG: hypothetical protein ABEK29_11650 [Bradymonadaceae bacterium]
MAVVGTAKNSGKTTTLNWLLGRTLTDGRTVGLVSIGVDGEDVDAIADLDKPPIYLPAGHWIGTAADAIDRSTARLNFHRQLGMSTPLGEVFVASTRGAGEVLLAGLRHRTDLLEARDALSACGADLVFIDGAYGRSVAADGRVAEAVVLATGAVLGATVEEVVEATRPTVERMQLAAPAAGELAEAARLAVERGVLVVRTGREIHELPEASALLGLESVEDRFGDALDALVIPGAVTDRVVDELLALSTGERTLVVASPAAMQVGADAWERLTASPWSVRVLHPVRLLGLAVNPAGPRGRRLGSRALVEGLREAFGEEPIVDPCRG